MNRLFTIAAFSALALSQPALAEIYKSVDANGNVTYSNVKIKGGQRLNIEQADTSFGDENSAPKRSTPAAKNPSPSDFPKVDSGTQATRDGKRKEILQAELDSEKAALEKAKQAYAEGESNPEVYKTAKGKTFRNVPKFEEKMKNLGDDVQAHERNIELLQKELGSIN